MNKEKKKILQNSFKENLITKKISPDKKEIIRLFFIYLLFHLDLIISKETSHFIISKYSYIRLKINGTGYSSVFSSYYLSGIGFDSSECNFDKPNEIHINNINKSEVSYWNNLDQEENIIDLIWNDNRQYPIYYTCSLFRECRKIIEIDLSHFDAKNVTRMEYMFYGCTALTSIKFGNFNTYQTTNMQFMFNSCISLKYLDLSSFNTSKVQNMHYMFSNCTSLNLIKLNFNTSSVSDMLSMFSYCVSLKCLNLSIFDTSKVESMNYMFLKCSSLTYLDISSFYTPKLKQMISMFANCTSLIYLKLNGLNTQNVENIYSMFEGCSSLTNLDLSNFYLPKITHLKNMFYGCYSLTSLNLSNFKPNEDLSSVENLFYNCSSLFVVDISNLKCSSNSLKIDNMFFSCSKLKYVNLGYNSFSGNKNIIRPNLYSLNDDIIVCGLTNFFSNDNSLCEIGTYCINNLYGINYTNDNHHCFIKCKEDSNSNNFTCPYYYPNNTELKNDTIYDCSIDEYINYSEDISNPRSTESVMCPECGENIIDNKRNELFKSFNKSYIDQGNDLEIYEDNLQFALSSTSNQKLTEKTSR